MLSFIITQLGISNSCLIIAIIASAVSPRRMLIASQISTKSISGNHSVLVQVTIVFSSHIIAAQPSGISSIFSSLFSCHTADVQVKIIAAAHSMFFI